MTHVGPRHAPTHAAATHGRKRRRAVAPPAPPAPALPTAPLTGAAAWPAAVMSTPIPRGFSLHPAGAPGLPPVPEPDPKPGFKLEGGENKNRNKPTSDREHPPRPLGVQSGVAWEPRTATRSYFAANITARFLEALDPYPQLQNAASAAIRVFTNLRGTTKGDAPIPADVADPAGAWKFDAIGDYGSGTVHQSRVAANMLASKPELVLTVGDNVYPTGRWGDYVEHWDPPEFMGTLARSVPFMPALGNHDMYRDDLRPYFGHFQHLEGRPYYTYVNKNAQFYSLDSDQDMRVGSAQYRWLEKELATSASKWKVVYLHYPLYGRDINAYTELREALQPLLARYGVQLLIAGHEHNYQRSVPIQGVTHILTGGGGQQVYPFTQPQSKSPWTARRADAFHHLEVSVGDDTMVVRAVDEFGKRIDSVAIPAGSPAPVADAHAGAKTAGKARRRKRAGDAAARNAAVSGAQVAAAARATGKVTPGLVPVTMSAGQQ